MSVLAIHQPNFFPWLGYFNKLRRADVFVFLDDVQHVKTGGTWSNRVKLLVGGEARWVTAPTVRAYSGVRDIRDIRFDESSDWRSKLLRTVEMNYRRAACFEEAWQLVRPLIENRETSMAEYNQHAIRSLVRALGLEGTRLVASSGVAKSGTGTALLIEIAVAMSADEYLAGGGAGGYQDEAAFEAACIKLTFQNYQHPTYAQVGAREFVPGLSIIDALMNCGIESTARLLQ